MLSHSMRRVVSGVDGGVSIPTPTYSWNHSGNPNSDPAGNNGTVTGATLANDSSGNPNEAYYFSYIANDNILYSSVNFGANDFSVYIQFIKHGDGDTNCDIISDHTGGEGWTIERQSGSNYRLVGWHTISTVFIVGPFSIANATLIKLFIIKSGTNVEVFINDVSVGSTGSVGSIVQHISQVMAMSALPDGPTQHNADITADGFRIWNGTALSAAQQTAQIAEGI